MCIEFFMLFLLIQQGCDSRSVSIVVNHQQFFTVEEDQDLGYIQLSDHYEKRLQLPKPKKSAWTTEFTKDSGDNSEKDSINSERKSASRNEHDRTKDHDTDEETENDKDTEMGSGKSLTASATANDIDNNIAKHSLSLDNNKLTDLTSHSSSESDTSRDNLKGVESRNVVNSEKSFEKHNNFIQSGDDYGRDHTLNKMDNDDEVIDDANNIARHGYGREVWGNSVHRGQNLHHETDSASGLMRLLRKKRAVNEQWKNSLPGAEPQQATSTDEPGVWEEVTDEELQMAKLNTYIEVAKYLGLTLLSVVVFVTIGICFVRDPIGCIFAFGTCCPCCIIFCPCVRAFNDKYLNMQNIVRGQLNKYMPGVIVNEDMTMDYYDPTPDELDLLAAIIDEMQD